MQYNRGELADISQLPPHITYEQYQFLREAIQNYYGNHTTDQRQQIMDRDILLVDYMWETGGRVGDVIQICYNNFRGRDLFLYTKKRKKTITITFDDNSRLIEDTLRYKDKYGLKNDERLFPMSKQNAWGRVKMYAKVIDFPTIKKKWKNGRIVESGLRPHLFRHGIAIHLLNQGVAIPIISARLGHSNPTVTMKLYLKVTPEVQRKALKDVQWR